MRWRIRVKIKPSPHDSVATFQMQWGTLPGLGSLHNHSIQMASVVDYIKQLQRSLAALQGELADLQDKVASPLKSALEGDAQALGADYVSDWPWEPVGSPSTSGGPQPPTQGEIGK